MAKAYTKLVPKSSGRPASKPADKAPVVRSYKVELDPSATQERLLYSYCGAARFAFNWGLDAVKANLEVRAQERENDVPEKDMTPALGWSAYSLYKAFDQVKGDIAPWHREVASRAFRAGLRNLADALKNWSDSKAGVRAGKKAGFPEFKAKRNTKPSATFADPGYGWLAEDRHHVRLMLPTVLRWSRDGRTRHMVKQLEWLHTHKSTRRLFRLVELGRVTIQSLTISYTGGRWQAAFTVKFVDRTDIAARPRPVRYVGGRISCDMGINSLVTLSKPVPGLTGKHGHIANPRWHNGALQQIAKLDRKLARATRGSRNHAKLKLRRARLYASVKAQRVANLHAITRILSGRFDEVVIENLNVKGMMAGNLARHIGDASFFEFKRQLLYKGHEAHSPGCDTTTLGTRQHGVHIVLADRFYPSSKTCSRCRLVKAKLDRSTRVFTCDGVEGCGLVLDRDVNAARNLDIYDSEWKSKLKYQKAPLPDVPVVEPDSVPEPNVPKSEVAGLRTETVNGDARACKSDTSASRLVPAVPNAQPGNPGLERAHNPAGGCNAPQMSDWDEPVETPAGSRPRKTRG